MLVQPSSVIKSSHSRQEIVAIGLCTCQRPQMLRRCLDSLAAQIIDDTISLRLIVVDNETEPNNRGIVGEFSATCPFQVVYVHEPQRGIARARNAVLDKAVEIGADWIAMLDDDEVAAPDWIAALMAPEYRSIPVLMGWQKVVHPDPAPFWDLPKVRRAIPEGQKMKTAYTNNVRFSTSLIDAGLRFNEALGLMGGEDNEFFASAHIAGYEIRRTNKAITREVAHQERLTYRAQISREYWCSASNIRKFVLLNGRAWAFTRKAHTVPLNLMVGAVEVAVSPFFLIAGPVHFKRRVLAGGKKIAKAAGRVAGMIGALPQPYRKVVGN